MLSHDVACRERNQLLASDRDSSGRVVKQGRTVELTMSVDLSKAKIRTQHTVALTPVLMSADSSREVTFPPIVIDGKTRHKVYLRAQRLESVELPPSTMIPHR